MAIGVTFIILAVLILAIWVVIEIKRMKHKIFAILLITGIIFVYVSGVLVFKDSNIDFTTARGVLDGTQLYFSWFGGVLSNLQQVTSNAINMDWDKEALLSNETLS